MIIDRLTELRSILLYAADHCDSMPDDDDTEFARLTVALTCTELWGDDAEKLRLAYGATCRVPRTFPETLTAAKVFTAAAQIVNDEIHELSARRNA